MYIQSKIKLCFTVILPPMTKCIIVSILLLYACAIYGHEEKNMCDSTIYDECLVARFDTINSTTKDNIKISKNQKYKPYKHTASWKWGKACQISGIFFITTGSLFTLGLAWFDYAINTAKNAGYIEKNDNDKAPTSYYAIGIASIATGTGLCVLSGVLKHKAKKKFEISTSMIEEGIGNGQISPIPAVSLTYNF